MYIICGLKRLLDDVNRDLISNHVIDEESKIVAYSCSQKES